MSKEIRLQTPLRTIAFRWEGEAACEPRLSPLSFELEPMGEGLRFEARVELAPTRNVNGFQRDLWRGDVAELFIRPHGQGSPCYFEYNFAAGGAWWAASFAEERQGEVEMPDAVEILEVEMTPTSWAVRALIRHGTVGELPLIGNVCGIFGQQPRSYASHAALVTDEIDFHRPRRFSKLLPWAQVVIETELGEQVLDIDPEWVEGLEPLMGLSRAALLAMPIRALNGSERAANLWRNADMELIADLVGHTRAELLRYRGGAKKELRETEAKMAVLGLSFKDE